MVSLVAPTMGHESYDTMGDGSLFQALQVFPNGSSTRSGPVRYDFSDVRTYPAPNATVGANPYATLTSESYTLYEQPASDALNKQFWSGYWMVPATAVPAGWVSIEVLASAQYAYTKTGYLGNRNFGVGAVDITGPGIDSFASNYDPWFGSWGNNLGSAYTVDKTMNAFNLHYMDGAEATHAAFVAALAAGNLALHVVPSTAPGVSIQNYALWVEVIYPLAPEIVGRPDVVRRRFVYARP